MPLPNQPVLTLRRAAQIVADPVSWVVDRLIPAGMLTVLSGKDKAGKTLLAWEFARAVSSGQPLFGNLPITQGPVIVLALDDPASVTSERLDQLGLADCEDLHVATPMSAQPTDYRFWDEVKQQVHSIRPKLVVMDALYLLLNGGSDMFNQAGGMAPLMQKINAVAEEGNTSVLLITHHAKGTGEVAGSFTIRATAKQILKLSDVPDQPRQRKLSVEGKLIERFCWNLSFNGPGAWTLDQAESMNLVQVQLAVKEWLQQGNRGTAEEIARAISRRTDEVRTSLGMLASTGEAIGSTSRTGGRGRPRQEYRSNCRPALRSV